MELGLQHFRLHYLAPATRRLGRFWAWWTGEIVAVCPEPIRVALSGQNRRLRVDVDGHNFIVSIEDAGGRHEIERLSRSVATDGEPRLPTDVEVIQLVLPAEAVLVRRLSLPLAVEENLREGISYQIDQQTPFNPEQVYFDCHIVSRDRAAQTMAVELVAARRDYVDALIADLADIGITPDEVEIARKAGPPVPANNLLPARRRRNTRALLVRHRNLAWLTVNLLLLAATLIIPLAQKQATLRVLEPELQQAMLLAAQGAEVRNEVEQLVMASEYLQKKKQAEPLTLRTLDEITRRLPDHSWLIRIDIDGREVRLQGQSSASASLIQLLEASAMLENVRFASPVTRIGTTNEDHFQISANLVREKSR